MMSWKSIAALSVLLLFLLPFHAESQLVPGSASLSGPGGHGATGVAEGPIAAFVAGEAARLSFQDQQAADQNWRRVQGLRSGTEVALTVRGSQPRALFVMSASESELVVTVDRGGSATETIARTAILIITRSVSHTLRQVAIGLAAGVGLGAALGCTRGSDSYASICTGTTLLFGGIGTGLGAISGANSRGTEVVYRAP